MHKQMYKIIIIIFSFILFETSSFSQDDYFLTLRYDKVNLRQGPSRDYPVKIFYKKKFLPVLVQDKYENFRKIKDHENNSGWIHVSQLSKKKAAIVINEETILFKNPTIYSKPLAILKKGKLTKIKKCKDEWCKVTSNDYKGWLKSTYLRLFKRSE